MEFRRLLLFGLGAALALPAIADAAEPIETFDVVYATAGDQELKLDIVRPEGEGPFPAVIAIHGGAWRGGNKADVRQLLTRLAQRGYVGVSPQYRFCPKHKFPAQIEDVKAAVRWVRQHAGDQKVDPERLGAVGFSAGGHLALLLGLTDGDDGLEGSVDAGAPSSRVQVVVNYFGPTDLNAPDIPAVSRPLLADFIGGQPEQNRDAAAKASPVTYASDDDPPVLTFQGTKDPLVPHSQATRLADVLTQGKVPGRVELLVGQGHGWGGAELERTLDDTFAFFDQHLKAGKK
jgi:acetyl esterase/lipase